MRTHEFVQSNEWEDVARLVLQAARECFPLEVIGLDTVEDVAVEMLAAAGEPETNTIVRLATLARNEGLRRGLELAKTHADLSCDGSAGGGECSRNAHIDWTDAEEAVAKECE